MSAMQRTKGATFEREVARVLGGKRLLEYQQPGDRASRLLGVDVLTDRFAVQCKRYRGYAPVGRLAEVVVPDGGLIPLLVTRADRQKAVVALYLEDFVRLVNANGDGTDAGSAATTGI